MDTQIDKVVWNDGCIKRVSENQTNLIENLATERDIDLNVMVKSRDGQWHTPPMTIFSFQQTPSPVISWHLQSDTRSSLYFSKHLHSQCYDE